MYRADIMLSVAVAGGFVSNAVAGPSVLRVEAKVKTFSEKYDFLVNATYKVVPKMTIVLIPSKCSAKVSLPLNSEFSPTSRSSLVRVSVSLGLTYNVKGTTMLSRAERATASGCHWLLRTPRLCLIIRINSSKRNGGRRVQQEQRNTMDESAGEYCCNEF